MSELTSRHGAPPQAPRKYWNESDARAVLDAWRASGLRLSAFARERGLSSKRLIRWRERLEPAGSASTPVAFHPVQLFGLPESRRVTGGVDRIEIVLGDGCEIRVPQGFAAEDLSRVLDVLQARAAC
jgi:hypothetical protein